MIQASMTELSQKSGVKLDEIIKHLLDKCCYWETKWITWKDNLVGNNLVFARNEPKLYETLDVPMPYNKNLNTLRYWEIEEYRKKTSTWQWLYSVSTSSINKKFNWKELKEGKYTRKSFIAESVVLNVIIMLVLINDQFQPGNRGLRP